MMQPIAMAIAVAALITAYATTRACAFFTVLMLLELPVVVPLSLMSPLSSRHRHHDLRYLSSNSFLSATKTSATSLKRIRVPSSMNISILEPIGNGTFGGVYHAQDNKSGRPFVVKCARAITIPEHDGADAIENDRARRNAISYLEIEAQINSKLVTCSMPPLSAKDAQHHLQLLQQQHLAPYVGDSKVNGTTYLVWEASGGEYTLEDYIEMDDGWVQLAVDLGLGSLSAFLGDEDRKGGSTRQQRQNLHSELAAEVLRQILKGLAYCHSCGIVHRDIKPANILVDPTSHTLRIIDFGSACCMSTWTTNKLGYRGENKGPRSILYCAPEEFIDQEHPYAFDIYGAAITWIRTILSEDRNENYESEKNATAGEGITLGLGNEGELFRWRMDVRNFGHNLVAWEEYATLHNTLPYGWDSMFGSSRHGIKALRLLSNMMSYNPSSRINAAEALISEYLNPGCDTGPPPELPPAMPFSIMSHIERWKKDKEMHGSECHLEDLFSKVIAVELDFPLGLTLGPNTGTNGRDRRGVMITDIVDGAVALELDLCRGDLLLAIGSIDVEDASLDHVREILDQWPPARPVSLLLVRNA